MAAFDAQQAVTNAEIAADPAHQSGVFPPFDAHNFVPQIIWLALIFGALYWLMSRIALPRVESILDARQGKLSKDLGDAATMQDQAKAAGEAYEQTLAKARAGAQTVAQDTHDRLHGESEAKRHALESDLNAKLATAEQQIGETKQRAMTNVAGIAEDAAASLVERLTGRRPGQDAVSAAVTAVRPS